MIANIIATDMLNYKAVIFDLDGTILDTLEDIRSAINYVLRCYDMEEASSEDVRRYVGHGFSNALLSAVREKSDREVDMDEFALMLKLLRSRYAANVANYTRPYEGMGKLLKDLSSEGIALGVLTNKDHNAAVDLINTFYADVAFIFVEGKKEGRALKPDKALTLSILSEHGLSPSDAIIVGDSEVDRETAENIGSPSLIVSYGFRTECELEESGIHDSLCSVGKLREKLKQLLFEKRNI